MSRLEVDMEPFEAQLAEIKSPPLWLRHVRDVAVIAAAITYTLTTLF